jgi:hypothetical protein
MLSNMCKWKVEKRMARMDEMSACMGGRITVNVRPEGVDSSRMFARMVAEIGGVDLVGYPHLRIGCWKGAELSERVVEN